MSFIDKTAGHSPRQEKKVARALYISIGIAIFLSFVVAYLLGVNERINPFKDKGPIEPEPTTSVESTTQ